MPPPRLTAQPIAEGLIQTSSGSKLVWREFRWNTGKRSKMWFVDPEKVSEEQVEIHLLDTATNPASKT